MSLSVTCNSDSRQKQQESLGLSLLIEKLKLQIARFKRTQFGQSSERYPGELMQLELLVEDLEANQAQSRVPEIDQDVATRRRLRR